VVWPDITGIVQRQQTKGIKIMATAYVNFIQWDTTTDEDPAGLEKHDLPTCFEFELDLNDFISEDAISDWITGELSDETGWCVSGFNYVIK
jgi:hypothetical protein